MAGLRLASTRLLSGKYVFAFCLFELLLHYHYAQKVFTFSPGVTQQPRTTATGISGSFIGFGVDIRQV